MLQLKVLFADDHIPGFPFPPGDKDASEVVRKHHPHCSESGLAEWLKVHRYCQNVIKTLRDANFDVTTANKYSRAIDSVKTHHFDIAIVDLKWCNDESLPANEQENAGWRICNQIDENCKKQGGSQTLQIISSSRFQDDSQGADLLTTTANYGRLPFVKMMGSHVNLKALRACVRFLEKSLQDTSPEA